MTQNILSKLWNNIKELHFQLGNYVYKEGEPITGVYIIKEGEFEQYKLMHKKSQPKSNNQLKQHHYIYEIRWAIIGKWKLIGLEEVVNNQETHQNGMKLISAKGVVYFIPRSVFKSASKPQIKELKPSQSSDARISQMTQLYQNNFKPIPKKKEIFTIEIPKLATRTNWNTSKSKSQVWLSDVL